MNGRLGNDTDKYTCYTGMGESSIDYLVCSKEIIPLISSFTIESFERCLSDAHCPLTILIQTNSGDQQSTQKNTDENSTYLAFNLEWHNK